MASGLIKCTPPEEEGRWRLKLTQHGKYFRVVWNYLFLFNHNPFFNVAVMEDKNMMHRVLDWLYQRYTINGRGFLFADRADGYAYGMTQEGAELIYDFLEYYFEPLVQTAAELEVIYPNIKNSTASPGVIYGQAAGFTRHVTAQALADIFREADASHAAWKRQQDE